ncbi:hypothetical protein [Aeromicrobium chenweiae]|uniref:Uncharacterized protein n=1 Tax=Aeromicrobium chenweiae TaxID=2079793 RepID=A0A2S0WKH0_9ACTN|nr:hypothetical protein [Aeromicrobium chenweiae]AWB91821.1 hypothetical protein C3E78_06145 [Aeromicrobium chenweiae]TGN32665.1 hypothetical protein E4L97_08110 [Aeromicrobium chenweiae]
MTDEIPPLLRPDQMSPMRAVADLDRFWQSLKGRWGFARPQLWCLVLGPQGEWTSMFMKIEDCPDRPDPAMIGHLFEVLTWVVVDHVTGGSVALMYARPGPDDHRSDDRRWARALDAAGRRARVNVWPVFLANDDRVRIAAPDDVAA